LDFNLVHASHALAAKNAGITDDSPPKTPTSLVEQILSRSTTFKDASTPEPTQQPLHSNRIIKAIASSPLKCKIFSSPSLGKKKQETNILTLSNF
jgi:hypothetical protein